MAIDGGAVVGRLEMNIVGWMKAVETVKKDQQSLSGLIMRHDDGIKKLGKAWTATGTAAVAALVAITKGTADYGEDLLRVSKQYGVSIEALSGLKPAAEKAGSSLDGLAAGFRGLSNIMADVASGDKDAIALFRALGIEVVNSDGSLRDVNDVLFDVADRFAGMNDGAEKAVLSQRLLGKSGAELIPMLNAGSAGLRKEREEAEKLGLVMSKEAAEGCAAFNDSLVDLKGGLIGLRNQVGQSLMPVLEGAVGQLTGYVGMIRDAAKEHPDLISGVGSLAGAFGVMGMTLGPLLIMLPKLATGWVYLKGITGLTTAGLWGMTAAYTVLIAETINYISKLGELDRAEKRVQDSTKASWEAENNLVDKLSAAASAADWQYGRMSELIKAYDFNYIALMKDIQAGKLGIDIQKAFAEVCKKHAAEVGKLQAATGGLTGAQQALNEKLGLALRVDLEKKYRDMLKALVEYKGQLTDTGTKKLTDDLIALRAELDGTKPSIITLDDTLKAFDETLDKLFTEGEVQTYGEAWTDFAKQVKRDFEEAAKGTVDAILSMAPSAELMEVWFKAIGDAIGVSAATVKIEMWNIQAAVLAAAGIIVPTIQTTWEAFSFGLKDVPNKVQEKMNEVSTIVADAMREVARSVVNAFGILDALTYKMRSYEDSPQAKYFDKVFEDLDAEYEKRTHLMDLENSAAEHALEVEYEKQKEYIEKTITDEDAKAAALKALDEKYYLDKKKLEEDQYQASKVLAEWFKGEKARIQEDEDKTSDWYARREEERQKGLWGSIKTIFGTAIENMLVTFLTGPGSFINSIFNGSKKATDDLGKVGDALGEGGVGGKVKGLGATIGEFISGIGTGIGGFISGLAAGIGAAIVSLATAIASAATILAAAAPAIITVGLIALGLMAGIKLLGSIFGSGGGSGAGDGMGRVVERQDKQLAILQSLIDFCRDNIGPALLIAGVDYMAKTMDAANQAVRWLDIISGTLKGLKGAASGAVSEQTELVMVHGRPDDREFIFRESQIAEAPPFQMAAGGGQGQPPSANLTFNIRALDGADVVSVTRRIIIPELQNFYRHGGMIPARAIGGA